MSNELIESITNSEYNQDAMGEVTMLSSLDIYTISAHMLDHSQVLDLGNQKQHHGYTVDFSDADVELLKQLYNFAVKHLKMGYQFDKAEVPASGAVAIVEQGESRSIGSVSAGGPMNEIYVKAGLSQGHITALHKGLIHFVSNHSRTVDNDTQRRLESTAQFMEDNHMFLVGDWEKIRRKI